MTQGHAPIAAINNKQTENLICFVRVCRRWNRCAHWGLASSGHQHWFCKNQQTLASGRDRFPLGTFFLAGFRDCRLLELHLLDTFSHVSLRPSCVFILQNNKLIFVPEAVHSLACMPDSNRHLLITNSNALPLS